MRKALSGLCLIVILAIAVAAAAQEPPVPEALADVPELIEGIIEEWKVPGLAIAVVKDGEVVFARGFGLRDVENGLPVTPQTLFAIGSSSKAFTAAALGMLVDEGKLDWDKPIIEYMPDFRMQDPYVTTHLTARDLVTHRCGLPRHDYAWYGSSASREQLVGGLRHLEPSAGFRDVFQYQNLMFMTAGYLLERITGQSWESFVAERFFAPLGMERSNFSVEDSKTDDNAARPYTVRDEQIRLIPFRNIDSVGPAGSINSSVEEMSRWVILNLGNGKYCEQQLVSENTLRQIHTLQMAIRSYPSGEHRFMCGYAMGWFIEAYRGFYCLHHGGGIDGFTAMVSFVLREEAGVVILTNRSGTPVPQLLLWIVYDRLLGLEPVDWNEIYLEAVRGAEGEEEAEEEAAREGAEPTHPLADYAGAYENPAYGRIDVRLEEGKLMAAFHGEEAELKHRHYDFFVLEGEDSEPVASFRLDLAGNVSELLVSFQDGVQPIVFSRAGAADLADPEYLGRFVGQYRIEEVSLTVSIELRGDKLVVMVPGQPAHELEPVRGNYFLVADHEGYTVEFQVGDEGEIVGFVSHQPGGVFTGEKMN